MANSSNTVVALQDAAMQVCTKCARELPLTVDYWYPAQVSGSSTRRSCKSCQAAYARTPQAKASQKRWYATPQAQAKQAARNRSPAMKAYQKEYRASPRGKAALLTARQKPERRARARAQRLSPEGRRTSRNNKYLRHYGISVATYDAMFAQQSGRCAVCHKVETAIDPRSGRVRQLAIDHDHTTEAVRGLLCWQCNAALGCVSDDPGTLRALIAYLAIYGITERTP